METFILIWNCPTRSLITLHLNYFSLWCHVIYDTNLLFYPPIALSHCFAHQLTQEMKPVTLLEPMTTSHFHSAAEALTSFIDFISTALVATVTVGDCEDLLVVFLYWRPTGNDDREDWRLFESSYRVSKESNYCSVSSLHSAAAAERCSKINPTIENKILKGFITSLRLTKISQYKPPTAQLSYVSQ